MGPTRLLCRLLPWIGFLLSPVLSKTVSVVNTAHSVDELGWPTYGDGGWFEETFTKDGTNRRAYVACELGQDSKGDNWLFLPPVRRNDTHNSNRLTLKLHYSLRECPRDDPSAAKCKETFEVFVRKQKKGQAAPNPEDFDNERKLWHLMRRWAGGAKSVTGPDGAKMQLGDDRDDVELEDDDDTVYFALHDDFACISVMGAEITYEMCEASTISYARFPAMTTAFKLHEYKKVEGECVAGAELAVEKRRPSANCKGDGQWELTEGCVCSAGYFGSRGNCIVCPEGEVSSRNATECTVCPRYSRAVKGRNGQARCECDSGYFRVDEYEYTQPCYGPPSRPRMLRVIQTTQKTARLTWQEPETKGGLKEVWYEWRCVSCTAEMRSRLLPSSVRTTETFVDIGGLEPGKAYTFEVNAFNAVSSKSSRKADSATVVVDALDALPHAVGPLKITTETDARDSITVSWTAPALPKHVNNYEVESKHDGGVESVETTATEYTVGNLKNGVEYTIRVRADVGGWGQWSDPIVYIGGKGVSAARKATSTIRSSESAVDAVADIPLWVIVLIALLVVLLLAFFALIFKRHTNNRKQMSDLDVLDTYKQDTMTPDYTSGHRQPFNPMNECFKANKCMQMHAPLIPPYGEQTPKSASSGSNRGGGVFPTGPANGQYGYGMPPNNRFKPYVDPMAYEDPNQALSEFAFDIPPEAVRVTSVIGGGEFGDVCKGQLNTVLLRRTNVGATLIAGGYEREFEPIACKTLKPGSGPKAKADFLLEASIMGQFAHPNVVRLIGVVTKAEPVMIVAEYMAFGSLDQFLRTRDARGEGLSIESILSMMAGIASGMKYLTDKGFVHRDLAARNVLVDEELTCKIADFGLSRGVDKLADQEYTTNGGKIPVRWTAPEAITHRKFTAASDVWSFGVVMWEVCSFGERPYWEWTNQKVISEIMGGYRLPAPMDTPQPLHRIMLWCWQIERHDRPTFGQLCTVLERYTNQPELLYAESGSESSSNDGRVRSMANLSTKPYGTMGLSRIPAPPSGAPPSAPPLEEFLRSLGLGHCYERLTVAGITRCDQLAGMNHLEMLGCGLISEEYQRIRDALAQLKASSVDRTPTSRRAYADTVATMPNRQGSHRSRTEDGFFV